MAGFFVNGFREIARRSARFSLRRQLAAHDRKRRDALAGLGRVAWQSGIDLTPFGSEREQLQRLDARAGQLSATAARLEKERADLEARRQAEVARFDALLQPARARQAEADAALKAARATLTAKDRAIKELESSLARTASELKKIDDQAAAGAGPAGAPAPAARGQLLQQQATLAAQQGAEGAARQPLAAEAATRADEAAKTAAEVSRLEAEKKAALDPLDADLRRIKQESTGASRERDTVGREQADRFRDLGLAVYDARTAAPELGPPIEAVAAIDRERDTTQAAIDGSLALSAAMPRGTMGKFWAVVVVVPLTCLAAAYPAYSRLAAPSPDDEPAAATSAAPAGRGSQTHAEQVRKDETVKAFVSSKGASGRDDAVAVLEADLMEIGSAADRSALPLLGVVLRRGEPELRAAAAHAIGMIGPTAAELTLLTEALNDTAPTVRDAVGSALDQVNDDSARLLVRRMRAGAPERLRSREEGLTPTAVPDAASLRVPIYPGATFLAFASNAGAGRVAFATSDPIDKVRQFYESAAGGPALSGEEFSRLHLGGSPGDPSGAERLGRETETWAREALTSGRSAAELEKEMTRRAAQVSELPLVRYADTGLYASPLFVAFGTPSSGGASSQTGYVAIFADRALGKTGFELHVPLR